MRLLRDQGDLVIKLLASRGMFAVDRLARGSNPSAAVCRAEYFAPFAFVPSKLASDVTRTRNATRPTEIQFSK